MPTARSETRRRYRDPRGYQAEREKARALARYEGKEAFEEPPYDDVRVVTLKDHKGRSIRVTEDQVAAYEAVLAEQAAAAKPAKAPKGGES